MSHELRYACGKWFAPPTGRYSLWLETDGAITPNPTVTTYAGEPFQGQGLAAITPLVPAGSVAIPADRSLPSGEDLRLLSIESSDWWNRRARAFDRRVTARASTPVQMPAGRVIVGRFDRKTNDAVALSKPVELKPRRMTFIWPTPPAASDVLLVLDKPAAVQRRAGGTSRLALDDGTAIHAPSVMLDASERIIAVWYGIEARRATISLKSDVAFWRGQEVRPTRGKVTTVRSRVDPLPSVNISVNAPPGVQLPDDIELEVGTPAGKQPLRRVRVGAGTQRIDALPPEILRMTLSIGDWSLWREVDLTSGEDARIDFDLQPINVSGTVFHGDEKTQAEIAFFNGGDWITPLRTNERGEYRTTFWWPKVHSAKITLDNLPPFIESFLEIFESSTVDFHIPRTDYRFRVRDSTTGLGIEGARVTVGQTWLDEQSRERNAAQFVLTDKEGVAILPPLRKGELIVEARAERYAEQEPFRTTVDQERHEIEIMLHPVTAARLRLLLRDGTPAAHAEIWAFDAMMQPVWQSSSDGDGNVDVADVAKDTLLLIRHERAASTIRLWDRNIGEWTLELPAEPLTLVAESIAHDRAGGAHVVVWLDGIPLSGVPLAFAAWSTAAANPSGIWIGRNLPPKALQVLAIDRRDAPDAAAHTFATLARRVEYPWPPTIKASTTR